MSSDLLFRSLCCSGYVMMASFSCKQSMHLFVVLLYAGACFKIDKRSELMLNVSVKCTC